MRILLPILFIACSIFLLPQSALALHPPTEHVLADGDRLLNAVTQTISLPANYVPGDLISLSVVGEPGEQARRVLVNDLQAMMNDAQSVGLSLDVLSGFRSYERQRQIHAYWHSVSSRADTFSAHAGHSQHQLGTALDFGNGNSSHNLQESFGDTPHYGWLRDNAWRYGFALTYPRGGFSVTGITFEPWHWRYIGRTAAEEWHNSGMILEEFLLTKPQRFRGESTIAGALLRAKGDKKVFRVASNNTKRWLLTARIFESYGFDWHAIDQVFQARLEEIPRTEVIRLNDNPGVYLLTQEHTKRGIGSLQSLHELNLSLNDVVSVNEIEFKSYPTGPFIP